MKLYHYRVIRENAQGQQGKRSRSFDSFKQLEVGGLYCHLGCGYPGLQRILSVEVEELPD